MAKKPAPAPAKKAPGKSKPGDKPKAKSKSTASCAVGGPSSQQQNISIRKIDNGYVVSRSEYRRGQYVERQTYTPSKPQIQIANAPKGGNK
jgi:hypothetical protein